jgi:hypothetical protein
MATTIRTLRVRMMCRDAITAIFALALTASSAARAEDAGSLATTLSFASPAESAARLRPGKDLAMSGDIGGYKRYLVDIPSSWAALADDPAAARRADSKREDKASEAEVATRKSYLIPALEILGFQAALNVADRIIYGCCDYNVTPSTISHNLRHGWVTDNDPYSINQLGHPYQGSMYHGFARSSGLNYWEALGYTFAASAVWEIAGERTPPSKNDQITTGIGGTFLGESLFRMANLLLEKDNVPKLWRELGAAAISPPTAFNRLVFDDRFDKLFASRSPAYYSRLQVGGSGTTESQQGTSTKLKRNEGLINFSMDYGLPGKPGYAYTRPFDYFNFEGTLSTANGIESLMTRGLLIGTDYDAGRSYRGVWGLYGSYDYISPQNFRVSSTAISLGTTAEWWLSRSMAMQYTALLGAGYASVGTINGTRDNDYHYGVAPQALLAMRFIFADRASLDITGREYFVSRVAADQAGREGHDNIARADAAITWRVHKQHAVAIRYQWSQRDASYPDLGDRTQSRSTVGIFYTLLGREGFSAQDWR